MKVSWPRLGPNYYASYGLSQLPACNYASANTGHKHIVSKNINSNECRSRKSSGHVLSIKVKLYLLRGEPVPDYFKNAYLHNLDSPNTLTYALRASPEARNLQLVIVDDFAFQTFTI